MIHETHLKQFKQDLLARQSKLIQQLQANKDVKQSEKDSVGELSSYDNHPADMATELYEREKDFALNEHAEFELMKINEALHAIDEGTYGICRVCSMDIELERLQANPATDTCIKHAYEEAINDEERRNELGDHLNVISYEEQFDHDMMDDIDITNVSNERDDYLDDDIEKFL